jgi:hypothetical protein
MKLITLIFSFGFAIMTSSCGTPKAETPLSERIVGDWNSGTIDSEDGPMIIDLTFSKSSELQVKITAPDPHVPGVEPSPTKGEGKYILNGNMLITPLFNNGKPTSISLEKDTLVIQGPGELPMRFNRINQ